MQATEIEKLRRRWGTNPCEHPIYVHEMDEDLPTGDLYCSVCGRMLTREICEEIDAIRMGRE